jgi:UDP-glucose 4-epimerase
MAEKKRSPGRKALVSRAPFDTEHRVIAVTGACGFFGSELVRRLETANEVARILAIDIRKPPTPMHKVKFHKIDLTLPTSDADLAVLFRRERVDTVVHCAFLSAPTHNASWAHELESIGTMHVLNASAEWKVKKLVVWSQTLVYGATPLNPNFLSEEHELRGARSHSSYVRDKVEAENQVRRFRKENPSTVVTVLRTAATLGPTIVNFATRFFVRPVAPMLMGFDPLMQFVHERDAAYAFEKAVLEDHDGEYNIVGDGVLPYSTVLALMGKMRLPLPYFVAHPLSRALWATQIFDMPPTFLDYLRFLCVADGAKAEREMAFSPRYDIRSTISDFLGLTAPQSAPYSAKQIQGAR